jgi:hypothetical protein
MHHCVGLHNLNDYVSAYLISVHNNYVYYVSIIIPHNLTTVNII